MSSWKLVLLSSLAVTVIAFFLHNYHNAILSCISVNFPVAFNFLHSLYLNHGAAESEGKTTFSQSEKDGDVLLSPEELMQYGSSGHNGKLYLSILGQIFDVTKGKKHYGKGGGYSFFTGRDASRAFVTGDFTENGLTDDVLNLTPQQFKGLRGWLDFYVKDYKYVGKLIGRYYDYRGHKTPYLVQTEELIQEAELRERESNEEKIKYPPCNSEWSASKGSRVWCSEKSGGISRDWIGVPRKLFVVGSSSPRCVCVRHPKESQTEDASLIDPKLEEYPGCHRDSISCSINI